MIICVYVEYLYVYIYIYMRTDACVYIYIYIKYTKKSCWFKKNMFSRETVHMNIYIYI